MKKRFSERLGITQSSAVLQTEGMNDALRNSIWNLIHELFDSRSQGYWLAIAKWVARYFRKVPVDELPYHDYDCRKWLKGYFYSLSWYEVYDITEFICDCINISEHRNYTRKQVEDRLNALFEREMSGYRFIAGLLAPISKPVETTEISGAIELTSRTGLDGAHHHLQTALALLAKKPEPDYRNSVKESISAVESMARILGREDSEGLASALDELSKKTNVHGALRAGFVKLYGYTSDEDGIRHAILTEPNVGFDEAKYMIVSCSAFVNYLISKAQSADLLKSRQTDDKQSWQVA